jgi:signal transduction histidine kinase
MIEITPQPTNFAMTFEAHCQLGWGGHEREGVRYVTDNRYNQLVINIDDANVGLIVQQIIQNAVAHTTQGFVRARYEYVRDRLIIIIEDTGCGMSQKALSQIFERFASGGKGTGLGLPICKELVEQMGGNIEINSSIGDGTTVWITIPCTATVISHKKDI